MDKEQIEIGDIVSVNFNNAGLTLVHEATVLRVPCATGDSWIFKGLDNSIHYVSEGCTVVLMRKGQDDGSV